MTFEKALEKAELAEIENREAYRASAGYNSKLECTCETGHYGPCLRSLPFEYDYQPFRVGDSIRMVAVAREKAVIQTEAEFLASHCFAVQRNTDPTPGQVLRGEQGCCIPFASLESTLAISGFEPDRARFVFGSDLDAENAERALKEFYYYGRAEQRAALLAEREAK